MRRRIYLWQLPDASIDLNPIICWCMVAGLCLAGCQPKGVPDGLVEVLGNERIPTFLMMETEVTNAQFQQFVEATGYVTTAEQSFSLPMQRADGRWIDSLMNPGSLVFKKTEGPVPLNDYSQWWQWIEGANWRMPHGNVSSFSDLADHPVVHVSYEDAQAYAQWRGMRLPTEQEWEWAAQGGAQGLKYSWGSDMTSAAAKANFWQGLFPFNNMVTDGFAGTAPVKSYEANFFGLHDMSGNVWEWCVSHAGPVVKGGSFLCNDSYCSGYAVQSRMPNDTKSSLNHTGFRCVKDLN